MGERLNNSGLTRVLQKIKTLFVLNSKDSDGMVLKGSGQANKVWKTNDQGEPAWRDEDSGGGVTVVDNNPTLAWGTKSKIATIDGTDIHATMMADPNTGTVIGTSDDLDTIYTVGRYYTDGLNLPSNSPVSGVNFELKVEYELSANNNRRKQLLTTHTGEKLARVCNNRGVWENWVSFAFSQRGETTVAFTSSGATVVDVNITFNMPFVTIPTVMLTPKENSSDANYINTAFIVQSVNAAGFVLRGIIESATDFTANVQWVAIQ